jgi:DMSO/TMAO reductase YedYZ molybdopterin-dependent catalytic subunit
MRRATQLAALCLTCGLAAVQSAKAQTTQTASPPQLKITGGISTPLSLTLADLKAMPRTTLHVANPHEKKAEVYEGVALEELLKKAGAPRGEQLRGPQMAAYVIAEAEDGYRVTFSLAELDSGIGDAEVVVADTLGGAPIGGKVGPLRLVAPHDKRPARWVRMLKSITVVIPQS